MSAKTILATAVALVLGGCGGSEYVEGREYGVTITKNGKTLYKGQCLGQNISKDGDTWTFRDFYVTIHTTPKAKPIRKATDEDRADADRRGLDVDFLLYLESLPDIGEGIKKIPKGTVTADGTTHIVAIKFPAY